MLKAILCGATIALAITTASAAPNQYLCIAGSVSGLRFDARTQSWKPQGFTTDERKYILRRITTDDLKKHGPLFDGLTAVNLSRVDWAFFSFGEDARLLARCVEGLINDGVWLPWSCHPAAWVPVSDVSTDSVRYEMVYRGGYIEQGYQERIRRDPERLKREPPGLVHDPSTPDDLVIEIGTCSPF
jgi:hypothetical protein